MPTDTTETIKANTATAALASAPNAFAAFWSLFKSAISASMWSCDLTTELSGQARRQFRAGEHAIYCEHGAATMTVGPL
jgi:hypothetical protein